MSNEIRTHYLTSQTLYALIIDPENEKVWYPAGAAFETHGTGSRTNADYAISLTELASGYYLGDWPISMTAGDYDVLIKIQAGANPANSDRGYGPIEKRWSGTRVSAVPEQNAVNVCNQALAKLGGGEDTQTITALGDGTTTSDLCDLLYTPVRKEVIARCYFQETIKYADLGSESSFSGEKGDWDYCFDLPSDCLDVIKQTHESCIETEYRSEVVQGMLFTNVLTNDDGDSAYIKYKFNETDASNFSQELINCIATKLAAELAPSIMKGEAGDKKRYNLLKEYESLVLPVNEGVNQSQQYKRNIFRSRFHILGGRTRL